MDEKIQIPELALEVTKEELIADFLRLRLWVGTCIGAEIAAFGGPEV